MMDIKPGSISVFAAARAKNRSTDSRNVASFTFGAGTTDLAAAAAGGTGSVAAMVQSRAWILVKK